MSSNKKAKIDDDFAQVRRYLLDCPLVAPDHPAIKAAVEGLDRELKRRERDAKLHQKFMSDAVEVEKPKEAPANDGVVAAAMGTTEAKAAAEDEAMSDDWHDISADNSHSKDDGDDGSIGLELSKQAIASVAEFGVRVSTPFEALAVALHAAMRSPRMGFACTGIPDNGPSNGFAAPVRELPSSVFLPPQWNAKKDEIRLRYRKNSTGSVTLRIKQREPNTSDSVEVEVGVYPTTTQEPPSEPLVFGLGDHVNLESFARAVKEQPLVTPALHYKSLSLLLTKFAAAFDLGPFAEEKSASSLPYVDQTIQDLPSIRAPVHVNEPWVNGSTPTIDSAFPGLRVHHPPGDFADDLVPGGLGGHGFGNPNMGGNLMGPNHPVFHGGMSGVGPNSGFGMKPRYDPIDGPPGGPTDPNNPDLNNGGNPRGRRHPGEPNPDHLRPPSNLNNNMFM